MSDRVIKSMLADALKGLLEYNKVSVEQQQIDKVKETMPPIEALRHEAMRLKLKDQAITEAHSVLELYGKMEI